MVFFITAVPAIILFFVILQAPFLPSPERAYGLLGLFAVMPIGAAYFWRKKEVRAAATVQVILAVCTLVLIEVLFRLILGPIQQGMPSINSRDGSFWYFKPNTVGIRLNEECRINSWGFRGPEPRKPEPGVTKVLILGDSIAFGAGFPEKEVFPWRANPANCEIINAAMPGYSLKQIARFYSERLHDLPHDLVILCFYVDDINRESRYKKWGAIYTPAWPEWIQDLFYTTRTANFLFRAIGFKPKTFLYTRRKSYEQSWDGALGLLDEMREESGRKQSAFAIFNIPRFNWDGLIHERTEYPHWDKNLALAAWCQDRGVPYHDTLGVFLNRDVDEMRISRNDVHFNKEGHRVMADELKAYIERLTSEKRVS